MSYRALIICVAMITGLASCSFNQAQSTESIDSKQIFGNADLVITFQIERLEAYLDEESKTDLQGIHEWIAQLIFLDTSECNELILQFGADEYGEGSSAAGECVGFVFRCDDDIPQELFWITRNTPQIRQLRTESFSNS